MKKYNILTKKFLIKKYIQNKNPMSEIVKEIGCSCGTIRKKLIKFGILIRTKSEAMKGINKGKKSGNYIDGRTNKKYYCIDCSKEISRGSKLGFCKECGYKIQSKKMKGKHYTKEHIKNMSLAKGGTGIPYENSNYPQEFTPELKLKIRKRDNYKCQNCGMTEEEHIILYSRVLEIHHIDYDKENCKENNLITTCKQCNIRVNYNRDYWTKYFKNLMEVTKWHIK